MASSTDDDAVEQYSELACEHDRLRLYGVLQLEPQRVAKIFLVEDGHTHVLHGEVRASWQHTGLAEPLKAAIRRGSGVAVGGASRR